MDAAQGFFDAEERDFCVGELLLERDGQRDGAAGADVGEVCAAVGLAQAVAEERDGGAGGVGGEGLVDGVDVDGDFGAPGGVGEDVFFGLFGDEGGVPCRRGRAG